LIYAASITSGALRLRESRLVADLLLHGVKGDAWREEIVERNLLQIDSAGTRARIASLLRTRLNPLGEGLWTIVRDGGLEQATQAVFAGAIKDSRLLGDFMDIAIREQRTLFAKKLEHHMWNDYIAGCRGRDPDMPHWSDSTMARLRSAVFSMLSEAGYLESTRSLQLQNVFVDEQLSSYLRDRNEAYVVRCMEVME
jgi:hypothetical protein